MKRLIIPISAGLCCTFFAFRPAAPGAVSHSKSVISSYFSDSITHVNTAIEIYNNSKLAQYGLSEEAFTWAWKGYRELQEKNRLPRNSYLTICDFSQSSGKKRLYIIDMTNHELVINTYVAHGKNSGSEYATRFSNTPESLQSSLGFYITQSTYFGEHGLSLRLSGVDPGFNDKALLRSIVLHGAAYVDEARARQGLFMGRSFGCPAVPQKESEKIITTIKNGTCLFIYHPSRNYLLNSKILNG